MKAQESFLAPPLGTVAIPRPENGLENPGILVHVGEFGALSPTDFPGAENVARIPGFGFQAPVQVGQNVQNDSPETIFLGYGSPEFPAAPSPPCDWRPPGEAFSLMSPLKAGWGVPTPKETQLKPQW